MFDPGKALVLFSGGQGPRRHASLGRSTASRRSRQSDSRTVSATRLNWPAANRCEKRYGRLIRAWAERLGSDQVIDLGVLGEVSESALTKSMEIALTDEGLPTKMFVPGRNLRISRYFRRDHRVSSRRQAHRRRVCAKQISQATRTAAMTRSRRCNSRSLWEWRASS